VVHTTTEASEVLVSPFSLLASFPQSYPHNPQKELVRKNLIDRPKLLFQDDCTQAIKRNIMPIKVSSELKDTQVDQAQALLFKFVKEPGFWTYFKAWIMSTDLSEHDLLEKDSDIVGHLQFMFNCDLNIEFRGYRTKNPMSSVIGHAEGNRVYENLWKLNKFTLPFRIGHLGHEICHLFGYHHEFQGQKTSVAVVFGKCMESYAERRLDGMKHVG
jgi:hypothetical protein